MSTKKAPAARRPATSKAVSAPPPQSAAERRAADAAARAFIESVAPDSVRLVGAVRRSLRKHLPTAHEIVYEYRSWFVISYSPTAQGYEGVLAIRGDTAGVKLYFNRGKSLPDPDKLLQGSGTQARFIILESASALNRPPVARLIELAIADTPVPFAATGKGPIVMRSASTAKARRKGRA